MTAGMGKGFEEIPQSIPPHHLGASILVTLFCCWPFGIVAIVYGVITLARVKSGDLQSAEDSSDLAEKWMYASCGAAFLIAAGYGIYLLIQRFT